LDQETGLRDPESIIRITPWTACKTGLKSKNIEREIKTQVIVHTGF
jgi:hypothetical protein